MAVADDEGLDPEALEAAARVAERYENNHDDHDPRFGPTVARAVVTAYLRTHTPEGAAGEAEKNHILSVEFDGENEWVSIRCPHHGPERPCAVIDCGVCVEDSRRECIEEHGAIGLNKCWAEEWLDAGGRETLNADGIVLEVPVHAFFDDGVRVEAAASSTPSREPEAK